MTDPSSSFQVPRTPHSDSFYREWAARMVAGEAGEAAPSGRDTWPLRRAHVAEAAYAP